MKAGLVLALVLAVSGCTYNIVSKRDEARVYSKVGIKTASIAAINAVRKANLSVTSSTTPADGVVVVSAIGGRNVLFQTEPARLTLAIFQSGDSIRIEATAIQGGQGGDAGYTDGMVRDVFTHLDAQLLKGGAPFGVSTP